MNAAASMALLLALAACAPLASTIGDRVPAQMATYEGARSRGDLHAIADAPVVGCGTDAASCAKLHGMRGDACLALAMQARHGAAACPGASAETTKALACAAQEYEAAQTGGDPANLPNLRAGRAQALYCTASAATDASVAPNADAAERAGTSAGNAAGLLWAGRAATLMSAAGDDAARCAALGRAAADARAGLALHGEDAAPLAGMAHDATTLASRIPSCPAAGGGG